MSTFVLLPGSGGTAWYWSRVVPLLTAAGHQAVAVDLPGDDPQAGLAEYTELAVRAAGDATDVILAAQSLGGFTAPLVCERIAVNELVLMNAMIPIPGETAGDWWGDVGAIEARDSAAAEAGYGPFELATYFLHDVAPEVAAEGNPFQRPEHDVVFGQPCEFTAWPDAPIRVLTGADDRFFPVGFQRAVARDRLGVDADVLPGGHLMALSRPRDVADYLLG